MKLFGLIGYPLSHSFSAQYFNNKFREEKIDADYRLFPIETIDKLPELLKKNDNFVGFNVTIPYKKAIFQYLDQIDETAKKIGAVNTVKIKNGKLIGYNTDFIGFAKTMENIDYKEISALILGTGGAAEAVAYTLKQLQIPFQFVSRTKIGPQTIRYADLTMKMIAKNPLIINATPLGMFPNSETKPDIPYDAIDTSHTLIDLIYNPEETVFLKEGKRRGARTKNGEQMLVNQAEASWKIWNDLPF